LSARDLLTLSLAGAKIADLDNIVANRKKYKVSNRVNFELAHDLGAVRIRGLDAHPESLGNLTAGVSLGEELDNFPFSRG
jgi:hypothetical protein